MTDKEKLFSAGVTRRNFLAAGSGALLGISAVRDVWGQTAPATAATSSTSSKPSYVEVETKYGRVRGAQGEGLVRFKGVPYGGSVSGPNRFKAAPPLTPWKGVRDALEYGPPSIQPNRPGCAEDCL